MWAYLRGYTDYFCPLLQIINPTSDFVCFLDVVGADAPIQEAH